MYPDFLTIRYLPLLHYTAFMSHWVRLQSPQDSLYFLFPQSSFRVSFSSQTVLFAPFRCFFGRSYEVVASFFVFVVATPRARWTFYHLALWAGCPFCHYTT